MSARQERAKNRREMLRAVRDEVKKVMANPEIDGE